MSKQQCNVDQSEMKARIVEFEKRLLLQKLVLAIFIQKLDAEKAVFSLIQGATGKSGNNQQ